MPSSCSAAVAIAVVVLILVVACLHARAPYALMAALRNRGWVVYYLRDCKFCADQQKIVKGRGSYICTTTGDELCGMFPGFPFWINQRTKESYTGVQSAAALRKMLATPQAS